jgi:hypothetical protein
MYSDITLVKSIATTNSFPHAVKSAINFPFGLAFNFTGLPPGNEYVRYEFNFAASTASSQAIKAVISFTLVVS